MLMVHGATLPEEVGIGSALYDGTQPEGDEVFWRVVDVAVDGPTVTLTLDWKLVGDPDTLAFFVAASSEGPTETDVFDVYPEEDQLPGIYPRRP